MEILRGIPVSHGVALGPALVLDAEGFRIPQQRVEGELVEGEIARLRVALAASAAEARETQRKWRTSSALSTDPFLPLTLFYSKTLP